jgi:hypothetical protein
MGRHCRARTFLNVAFCLLVCWLVNYHPSLPIRGLGKFLGFLVLSSLLMFVVAHSPEIHRVAVDFVEAIRRPLFSLVADQSSMVRPLVDATVSTKPILPPFFQRPPPFPLS